MIMFPLGKEFVEAGSLHNMMAFLLSDQWEGQRHLTGRETFLFLQLLLMIKERH